MPIGFNPSLYQLSAYTAPLIPRPVKICTTAKHQSQILQLTLDWVTVAPTFAVQVNLNQGHPGQVLTGGIQGVYIDNTANSTDLILVFPDTGYLVLVPVNESRFFPVFSNTNIVNIYNGTVGNTLAAGTNVNIIFTNFLVDSFDTTALQIVANVNLATSTTSGNLVYVTGVKGDKHVDDVFNIGVSGTSLLISPPPLSKGVFIITNYQLAIFNAYSVGAPIACSFGIRYGTTGTVITTSPLFVGADGAYLPYTILRNHDNEYMVLDATQTINAYFTGVPGAWLHYSLDFLWTTAQ